MGFWQRFKEAIGISAPIAVHDPLADEGKAPAPGELEPDPPPGMQVAQYPDVHAAREKVSSGQRPLRSEQRPTLQERQERPKPPN